ncbi:conserved domain protein, partial [Trichinella spiralis]
MLLRSYSSRIRLFFQTELCVLSSNIAEYRFPWLVSLVGRHKTE